MPARSARRRRPAAARLLAAAALAPLATLAAPSPSAAAFLFRPAATQPAGPAVAAAERPGATASCGYSSADLLAAPPGGATGAGGDRYWLRCGESLVVALARWGLPDGILVIAPAGQPQWRAATDYRFDARDFADALERLERGLRRAGPAPVLRYDRRNRVLTVTAPKDRP